MIRPKVIVHIITTLDDGGAEAALYRLALASGDKRVHVVTLMGEGKYGAPLEAASIPVTCLNMPAGRVTLRGLIRLWKVLRRTRPDVVQTWMYHADLIGGVVARLAGVRNIFWGVHNSILVPGQNARSTILVARLCARLSTLIPRAIICCARKAAEVHVALGYDADRIRVVPNGYDLSLFQPDAAQRVAIRSELGVGKAVLTGVVARFDPAKDHSNLLSALAILKLRGNCSPCLLIGNGMETSNDALVAMIDAAGVRDHVVLLGRRSDIPAIMNALDVHILSSSAEAFPNVIAEAMACGTPCVSTDVGDVADIVGDSGWIIPPQQSEALADAIEAAVAARTTEDWPARRERARCRIATYFSLEQMRLGYAAVWAEGSNENKD